ncbi:glutathione S-transferase family protein [Desulfopila sp. IMCC35008]|uniref:glutathione S-transferase family protein n=1 Tax=Desulfopila sp. IMCC35008 TaxID=2653858 RepID=UPI0013D2C55D|nr:glutathione S-transferase family protein [Desulfopila sp. IMCC35008]
MQLVIGNKNYSSWSLRAWLLPAVHNIAFEEIRIPLGTKVTKSEILRYSKAGKVPVLYDGDVVVWDSLAILEYISEQYLDGKGWPDDVSMRAEARSCCAEMHSGFFTLREDMPMNCRAKGRQVLISENLQKDITRVDDIWSALREKYSEKGPWLFGLFSIADCMFAPVVFRFQTYGVTVSETSRMYMETVLSEQRVKDWLRAGEEETEKIEVAEVG